jgi:hypothetical protein
VGVRREEVDPPGAQQRLGGAPRGLAVLAGERPGGDLQQGPPAHDVAHPVGGPLHRLGALGVRQDHAVPPDLQVAQRLGQPQRPPPERHLQQQPVAVAQARQAQVGVAEVRQPVERHLGAGHQAQRHLLGVEARLQVAHPLVDRRRRRRITGVDVRGADDRPGPRRHRRRRHRDRVAGGSRSVVDVREDVAVEVDHRPRVAVPPGADGCRSARYGVRPPGD